jgi:hypothetical protein
MTDLLLKPEDTGEIPAVDPDAETRNLTDAARRLPPTNVLRLYMPDAPTDEVPGYVEVHGVPVTLDPADLVPASQPDPPRDPPPPPPPPTPGRHRRASRWDWLTVPLSIAVQRIRGEHRDAGR